MNGRIYVVTTRQVNIPMIQELPEYELVQSGKPSQESLGYLRVNTGDNIAMLNEFYAELIVHYWAWQNTTYGFVGIVHYHRFLFYKGHLITKSDIEYLLKKFDLLVPRKLVTESRVESQWNRYHNPKDMRLAKEAINKLCPEYMESFIEVMNQYGFYIANIFICRKELFDLYCQWLFPILEEIRPKINIEDYKTESLKRVGGFLAERLFNVWIQHNKLHTYELEIKIYPSHQFDVLF